MTCVPLSETEKAFISRGCSQGIRYDGRGAEDYRPISFENDVFPHVNGSSRVRIANSIDIICSIKLEVSEPLPSSPEQGTIEVYAEFSPSCKLNVDDRALNSMGLELGDRLQNVLTASGALDLNQFSIISGKFCWSVQIDLLILQVDGDPLEACSIATYIALNCTRVPQVELSVGESGLYEDFDVSGDLADSREIDCSRVPLVINIVKVGTSLLVDSSGSEQACAGCAISIAVDKNGDNCGVEFLQPGLMQPDEILRCIEQAQGAAKAIFTQLDVYFQQHSQNLLKTFAGDGASAHGSQVSITAASHPPDVPPERLGLLAP